MSLRPETVALSARDSLLIVESLYDGILHRNGDAGGIDHWVGQLESGAITVQGVAASMFASQEALDLYAGSTREDNIEALYQQILGREYDADGMTYWMNSGLSIDKIALTILNSQEALLHNGKALIGFQAAAANGADFDGTGRLEDFATSPTVGVDIVEMSLRPETVALSARDSLLIVESLYDGILHRNGDAGGIDHWVGQLESGAITVQGVAASMFASQEALDLYAGSTREDNIEALYQQILGREYDADGMTYWMNSGLSIDKIALTILNSQEALLHNGKALIGFQAAAANGADFDGTGRLEDFATSPTVVVDIVDASLSDGDNNSQVTFAFSKDVTGFDASDVTPVGGKLSGFEMVDGSHYTATFTADDDFEGPGSVTVGTGYTDIADNAGTAGSDNVSIDTPFNGGAATATITGDAQEDQELTANLGADPDGAATAVHYQWKSDGTDVGADQSTYVLTDGDAGKAITVVVSYTDGQGFAESVTSAATDTVTPFNDGQATATITGDAQEDQTLTANLGADPDGAATAVHYQWKSDGTDVGADQSTYVLTDGDVGKAITVVVSYTDGQNFAETATSAATDTVTPFNDGQATATITGTAQEDQTLTANLGADPDGAATAVHYQWKSDGTDVGADQSTYVLTDGDVGKAITVVVSYTDGQNFAETATSAATDTVTPFNDGQATATITGTAQEDQTLTANLGADPDGAASAVHYQWQSGGTDVGTDQSTYVLTDGDVGKAITVVVSYTDGQNFAETATSAATDTVTPFNDGKATATITGSAQEDQTLTANLGADPDGAATGVHYQWKSGGSNVGTDQSTYAVTDSDVGKAITVVVSYTDGQNFAETATSAATTTVRPFNDGKATATITGDAQEDQELTANLGADPDGAASTVHYQWKSDGTDVGTDQSTYSPTDGDVGKAITVVVSYTDGQGFAESVTSVATPTVTPFNNGQATATITGDAQEDQELTANLGADPDGAASTVHYQWKSDGSNVGADQATFAPTDGDVGKAITVVVSYTDGQGFAESVSSVATGPVANVNDDPTGTVTISGTATEDQVLTASNTLADADGLGTISYQWQRGGVDIGGATGTTYKLGDADVGASVTVVASYTDGHAKAESVSSVATGPVANVNDDPTGTVTISGTATEDQVLTASNTLADADGMGAISYQWQRGGVDIGGATGTTYKLGDADVGASVTVVASYTDGHAKAESVSSAATGPVANASDPNDFDSEATLATATKASGGADTIHGTINGDNIDGGGGNDVIYGGAGNDISLKGGDGNDTIYGGSGADTIVGGKGADTLYGGSGNDTFVYGNVNESRTAEGIDMIVGFTHGDLIDVSAIDAAGGGGNQAFAFGGTTATANGVWYEESGANTLIHFDTNGSTGTHEMEIVLTGVGLGLTASDFHL